MITYDMAAPNPPQAFAVQLLRDRVETIPDVVKVVWQKATTNPGDGIEIVCYDYLDKKHALYSSNGSETEARLENVSRFIVQDTPPAVARPYRFAIVSTNRSGPSEEVFAAAPLSITSKVKPVEPPTPDEIAGTARAVNYATLKAEVFADVLAALGTLPAEGQAIVNSTLDTARGRLRRPARLRAVATLAITAAAFAPKGLGAKLQVIRERFSNTVLHQSLQAAGKAASSRRRNPPHPNETTIRC
jgi:hypothetical protein